MFIIILAAVLGGLWYGMRQHRLAHQETWERHGR